MHIPDGFLTTDVALACAVPAAVAVGVGLRKAGTDLDERRVPLLGVTAAFVFAAQMLNFPGPAGRAGTSSAPRWRRSCSVPGWPA